MSGGENDLEQQDCTTMSLPDEILSCIFAFLRLEDRKSVRLVCRSWYRCSTYWFITKNEKFVFRKGVNIEDVTAVMTKLNYKLSNLEFQSLSMNSLPANLWKECGHQIKSLEFFRCDGNAETIKDIIECCENLISFTFWLTMNDKDEILRLSQFLDELVEKDIRRTKLRILQMSILPDDDVRLSKIFLLYPCISHLTVHGNSLDSFSRIPISLESLFVNLPRSDEWLKVCLTKAKQGLRLKRFVALLISIPIDVKSFKKNWFKFFSSQENLNAFYLQTYLRFKRSDDLTSLYGILQEITFHILESYPNLQEFCILRFPTNLEFISLASWADLSRFFASISKLQRLSFSFCSRNINRIESLDEASKLLPIPMNLALTILDLSISHDQIIYNALLPHCPLLLHLKLARVFDSTLQIIFKYLLKLQTLILNGIMKQINFYPELTCQDIPSGKLYSIKQLQQLKHLEISCLPEEDCSRLEYIVEVLEFELPHLEVLKLDSRLKEIPEDVLVRFKFEVPELKEFIFVNYSETFCVEKVIQFCKRLKKLDRLGIWQSSSGSYNFLDMANCDRIEEIFHVCTSLRYISFGQKCDVWFSFDRLTKKVVKIAGGYFKFRPHIFSKKCLSVPP